MKMRALVGPVEHAVVRRAGPAPRRTCTRSRSTRRPAGRRAGRRRQLLLREHLQNLLRRVLCDLHHGSIRGQARADVARRAPRIVRPPVGTAAGHRRGRRATVGRELRDRAGQQRADDPLADAMQRIADVALGELLARVARVGARRQRQRAVDGLDDLGHADRLRRAREPVAAVDALHATSAPRGARAAAAPWPATRRGMSCCSAISRALTIGRWPGAAM